jgi:phi LC3 family holin|nr:MAG TPA: holin [Caudoviricetes sp.]
MKSINWKVRMKNPLFWVEVGLAVISTALVYNSLEPQDLTSWNGLGNLLVGIISNPYLLFMCGVSVFNAVNDPTTKGFKDSNNAINYSEPK